MYLYILLGDNVNDRTRAHYAQLPHNDNTRVLIIGLLCYILHYIPLNDSVVISVTSQAVCNDTDKNLNNKTEEKDKNKIK